jgi:ribosomal protein L21E
VAVLAVGVPAWAETVEGTITEVELHDTPRHIKVRTGGDEVQITIANRTNVDFDANDRGYYSEELSSLKAGMEARVTYDPGQPARRISVLSVPSSDRAEAIRKFEAGRAAGAGDASEGTEMKVRLLDVNRSRGTFRAQFKDTQRTFHAGDPKVLASFVEGDTVIVKVRPEDHSEVTDIRSAALVGRVVDIDRTAGRVTVSVDGQDRTFKIDRIKELRLSEGDRIRFQVEERDLSMPTITDVSKINGVEKVR